MSLHLLDHPLAAHLVTQLRDRTTPAAAFRAGCRQLSFLLAVEASRGLPTTPVAVSTPLEATTGGALAPEPLVVVPVLRAGLGMLPPFLDLFPHVSVGFIGLERDHATATARQYYVKLPALAGRAVFVVDPMLATGGSAAQALQIVRAQGAAAATLVCIFAAPEGIAEVQRQHPDVPIHAAVVDRELNPQKYILPGVGDFGDRLFGA